MLSMRRWIRPSGRMTRQAWWRLDNVDAAAVAERRSVCQRVMRRRFSIAQRKVESF
jgi:hypothetical protein